VIRPQDVVGVDHNPAVQWSNVSLWRIRSGLNIRYVVSPSSLPITEKWQRGCVVELRKTS
jgi:hypothetical protein